MRRANHNGLRVLAEGIEQIGGMGGVIGAADRNGVAIGSKPLDFVKGEVRAGGDDEVVVGQAGAITQIDAAFGRVNAGATYVGKADPPFLHHRREVHADRIGFAPAHSNPRVTWYEPIVVGIRDNHHLCAAFCGVAKLIGGDGSAEACAQNDDAGQ